MLLLGEEIDEHATKEVVGGTSGSGGDIDDRADVVVEGGKVLGLSF